MPLLDQAAFPHQRLDRLYPIGMPDKVDGVGLDRRLGLEPAEPKPPVWREGIGATVSGEGLQPCNTNSQ